MSITNEFIGKRIREARKQRDKTQADLAEILGKTPGAISQLEMGNVQIPVVELQIIAQYLNKPIEFFFGEDYLGDDVLALIAIFRKMDYETRAKRAKIIRNILEMQEIADKIADADEAGNEQEMKKLGVKFYNKLVPFITSIQEMTSKGNQIQEKLGKVLEIDIDNIDSDFVSSPNEK